MSLVYVKNKKNGTTYVYESTNYWDKEKKKSRSKRVCIGKLDEAGNLIPSKRLTTPLAPTKQGTAPSTGVKRSYYGATYLFDQIGDQLGLMTDLKACFPDTYRQILSIAYFLILEDRNTMRRFAKWDRTHAHPFGKNIPSQRSSDLFMSVTEEAKQRFFSLQAKRRGENEYWAYDTTSVSSYSELLHQVNMGLTRNMTVWFK